MKMAQSLNQAARWVVVVAATIALIVAFSLPSAGFFSASSSDSVVAFGRRHGCCGARRVHRHRGYRSCGSTGCGASYSACGAGGCNVGGGCTIGGGCN
ncbi:hypothetical protein [Blastopirellula marina]|uniref:Uncharacterized protein n=1 Tax=Blastopirellula marina DSM 3645 TaxID=314230 RepID=A3ZXH8_9BACT|nr:hypothetical protein [Blastopirellula marina]EAQ78768.1 hypothetical protein DSM3645_29741 [Blastopirellula marina DSM 3645]